MRLTKEQTRALFFAWLPAAIGVFVIGVESSDYLSAARTGELLEYLCRWMRCGGHQNLMLENHILRKSGHFTGYGMLSLLLYRAWRLTGAILSTIRAHVRARLVDVIFSLACTLAVSSADEYHQTFLPSRTGRFQDVLLDMAGAAVFLLVFQLWLRFERRRRPESSASIHIS
jgi:VanZ family protein